MWMTSVSTKNFVRCAAIIALAGLLDVTIYDSHDHTTIFISALHDAIILLLVSFHFGTFRHTFTEFVNDTRCRVGPRTLIGGFTRGLHINHQLLCHLQDSDRVGCVPELDTSITPHSRPEVVPENCSRRIDTI